MKAAATLCALLVAACAHRAVPTDDDGAAERLGDSRRARDDRERPGDGRLDASADRGREAAPPHSCPVGPRLVYLIDDKHRLYAFDPSQPAAAAFKLRGTLACPLAGTPYSMAVRRSGTAYVLYTVLGGGGWKCTGLARVDIETLSCSAVKAFKCTGSGDSVDTFGMGYALTGPEQETLFVGTQQGVLARLEPEAGALTSVGPMPDVGPELSGNSNGELWGFFPKQTPARVHRLDPQSGKAVATITLSQFDLPWAGAFAFASWGGVFYIFYGFTPGSGSSTTSVFRLTPDGKLTTHVTDSGLHIVGAGVSTCAPSTGG